MTQRKLPEAVEARAEKYASEYWYGPEEPYDLGPELAHTKQSYLDGARAEALPLVEALEQIASWGLDHPLELIARDALRKFKENKNG